MNPFKPIVCEAPIKATRLAGMAGRASGPRDHPDRILIAVDPQLHHMQHMAGCLAFLPQPPPAARPEMRDAARLRQAQRLGVHMREHQHRATACVRHYRGDEAVGVIFGVKGQARLAFAAHKRRVLGVRDYRGKREMGGVGWGGGATVPFIVKSTDTNFFKVGTQ